MITIPFLDNLFHAIKPQVYDGWIDRLNYYYTTLLLLFFALMVAGKQYVGSPIQCWVPAQYRGGWEQYTEDYCFIQNTYYLPLTEQFPDKLKDRKQLEIGYYQWVPIVLAIQAFLFFLPSIVWKVFCWQTGMNVEAIMKHATDCSALDPDKRKESLESLARYMEDTLSSQKDSGVTGCRNVLSVRWGKNLGSYLNSLYIFIKLLYVVNVIGQFFLLNSFLGTNYKFWGLQIASDLLHGREWTDSGHFPRVTMCDFKVRTMGNVHDWSVQCVLMINLFNEKIYLLLWFWFVFVGICTCVDILYWLVTSLPSGNRERVVRRYLRITHDFSDGMSDRRTIRRFTHNTLRPDGVLVLRFISAHAGDMISMELTSQLWRNYAEKCLAIPRVVTEPREKAERRDSGTRDDSKSASPSDNGFSETLYDPPKKPMNGSLTPLIPSAPRDGGGYPGPPAVPPKPGYAV